MNIPRTAGYALTILMVLFAASCTTVPVSDIQVTAETAPGADTGGDKTYAWLVYAEILHDPDGRWEPRDIDIDDHVRSTIGKLLRERGWKEVRYEPDVFVAYAIGVDMNILELVKNPEHDTDMLENVPKAALVVALIDTSTGYVMWIGQAVGNVQDNPTEQQLRARIKYAIEAMFARLPGGNTGNSDRNYY